MLTQTREKHTRYRSYPFLLDHLHCWESDVALFTAALYHHYPDITDKARQTQIIINFLTYLPDCATLLHRKEAATNLSSSSYHSRLVDQMQFSKNAMQSNEINKKNFKKTQVQSCKNIFTSSCEFSEMWSR